MKNTVLKLAAGILLAAVLTGCSWKIPQKVSVKTKSEYNFTVAKIEKDLGNYIGLDKLRSVVPENSGLYMYEYNPAGASAYKQFLIKKNITTVPVNLSKYMAEITQDVAPVSQKISVPEVASNQQVVISADSISADLGGSIKFAGLHPAGTTAAITGEAEGGASFNYFEYESGEMYIYLAKRTSNSETPKVLDLDAGVTLLDDYDNAVASADFEVCNETKTISYDNKSEDVTLYYKATIPLARKRVSMSGMKVQFNGVNTNPALVDPENATAFFCGEVADTSKISRASGVTVANYSVPVAAQTISSILPAGINSLTVGEGNISVQATLPEAWTGVSLAVTYVTTGALSITDGKEGKVSLADKVISKGDVTFTPTVTLNIADGELDFSQSPNVDVAVTAKKIKSLTVDVAAMGIKTDQSVTPVALPASVTDIVKTIWFGASEFDVTAKNTLPAGNDITLTCKSDLLGLAGGAVSLTAGGAEVSEKLVATAQDTDGAGTDTTGAAVDFTAAVGLPGLSADGSEATFANLEAGSEYEISIEVKPSVKWNKMTLDMTALGGQHIESSFDTGINFGSLTASLAKSGGFLESLKFKELPVYLYCQKPDMAIFDSLAIKGKIAVEGSKTKYLLGDDSKTGDMSFAALPDLALDDKGIATANLATAKKSSFADLAEVVTFADDSTMKISYNLDMSGTSGLVTLTPAEVESTGNLEISAYIAIPLALKVTKEISVDVMKAANKTGDLLGRTEGYNVESYSQYLAAIDEAAIIFDVVLPINVGENPIGIRLDLYSDSTDANKPKPIELNLKGLSLKMSGEEIEYLLTHLTSPKAELVIPEGELGLNTDMKAGVGLTLRLKTDGTVPVFEGK